MVTYNKEMYEGEQSIEVYDDFDKMVTIKFKIYSKFSIQTCTKSESSIDDFLTADECIFEVTTN